MAKEWSTQTELGVAFGLSAREIGSHLTKLGLKSGKSATQKALDGQLARSAHLRDGTPFFLWHHRGVSRLLLDAGLALDPEAPKAGDRARSRKQKSKPAPLRDVSPFDKVIATDGSALGNPGPTGWAWVDQTTGEFDSGGQAHGTNNIGELTAVLEALRHAGRSGRLLLRCDSQYAINVTTTWGPSWRKRGWRKGDGKTPENLELVQAILVEMESRTDRTEFEWVKGHAGDEFNEQADRLANDAASSFAKADALW